MKQNIESLSDWLGKPLSREQHQLMLAQLRRIPRHIARLPLGEAIPLVEDTPHRVLRQREYQNMLRQQAYQQRTAGTTHAI